MPGPNLITALRGLKVRIATLDKYLMAHGMPDGTNNGSIPPFYKYDDRGNATEEISELLRAQARAAAATANNDNNNSESNSRLDSILLVIPWVGGHDSSPWVYIAYSYHQVYAHRQITAQDPPEEMPRGFKELRQEILKHSASPDDGDEGIVGLFVVFTEGRPGRLPPALLERYQVRKVLLSMRRIQSNNYAG